jgi:hypothetical protein
MRKLIGLCFLTATLLASAANAQSIFIDKGDPSTMSVTLGGSMGNAYGGALSLGYSYRGVIDMGLDVSGSRFTAGRTKNLNGLDIAPYLNWHAYRSDVDEMPISISFLVAMEKLVYNNNGPVAPPEGWGVIAGGTIYRRIDIGTSMAFIPEALIAYDFMYTRFYSNAGDQNGPTIGDNTTVNAPSPVSKHSARALLRLNLGFLSGGHVYTVTPYGGYQGSAFGVVAGLSAGVVL